MNGLVGSPFTKFLMVSLGANSILTSIMGWKPYLALRAEPHLLRDHQYCLSTINHGQCLVYTANLSRFYGTLSSLVFQYYYFIPAIYRAKPFGKICISDKAIMYALLLQLAFLRLPYTAIPVLSGLLSGFIYALNIGNTANWRFPSFVRSFVYGYVGSIFSELPPRRGNNTIPPSIPAASTNSTTLNTLTSQFDSLSNTNPANNPNPALNTNANTNTNPNPNPSLSRSPSSNIEDSLDFEDNIAMLSALFPSASRQRLIDVLRLSNNDPNVAASRLLDNNS
ncbi:hypothetical protein AX774_g4447 [Zancudomyces culisetae]|uniref:CUE domain-containing protein n=1 Tax=Zancudomyces culisetae TaxID=1213189 RepID=A0A1R1PM89_ZANCU|nr:hypothetical protein AX774_g4447 [Zancudomyces culisetae]|eukprot:OMH82088.1 hypothetical protein AX774_g4447 [Zancudomyces culisetae]